MSRTRRPFTAAERAEAHRLCFAGRSGNLPAGGTERAMALMKISPDEYREIGEKARREADLAYVPAAIYIAVAPYCEYCNDTRKITDSSGETHRCDHCAM